MLRGEQGFLVRIAELSLFRSDHRFFAQGFAGFLCDHCPHLHLHNLMNILLQSLPHTPPVDLSAKAAAHQQTKWGARA